MSIAHCSMGTGKISFKQISYVSTAEPKLSTAALTRLLHEARQNNEALDITGLLVYADGSIMQVIEGAPSRVDQLFDLISHDPRHRDIIVITNMIKETRDFSGWRMAFAREDDRKSIDNYVNLYKSKDHLQKDTNERSIAGKLMAGFIERAKL